MSNETDPAGTHRRRPRYSGRYPRKFTEKYKELQPEKYPELVAHVIAKGSTPAGMHRPIFVKEILDFLQVTPGQIGLDATLGYGGHSLALLKGLQGRGHLYGLDVDPQEIVKTRERLAGQGFGPDIFTPRHLNFARIGELAAEIGGFDFVLADLGVSSMQIDNPARGFSYKQDGPLDLRLDPESGISAAERLRDISADELAGMLRENADEPYAAEIAQAVIRRRQKGQPITTTAALAETIAAALSFLPAAEQDEAIKKSCQRSFQALRIDVNNEFEALYSFLEALPDALRPGGRAAILTFHSGEDRLVKQAFKRDAREGLYRDIAHAVIRPSQAECYRNSRARSTKLRWAIKA